MVWSYGFVFSLTQAEGFVAGMAAKMFVIAGPQALVKEFVMKYQKELLKMWETEKYFKLPPLN